MTRIDGGRGGRALDAPDVVIAGAARTGTSYFAARLSRHPLIDGGAIKEPEYFSRNLHRGAEWYDSLYQAPREDLRRLDASMSYTVPRYPEAMARLARAAPDCLVIYAVRDPISRAVSHYRLLRQYFAREEEPDFGSAIRDNPVYLGASDYRRWLEEILDLFPEDQVLVSPFTVTTATDDALEKVVYSHLGVEPADTRTEGLRRHRNEVVEFRSDVLLRARRIAVRTGANAWFRRRFGSDAMRRLRAVATRPAPALSVADALGSCDSGQILQITELAQTAHDAVRQALARQDERLGLKWSASWPEFAGIPSPGAPTAPPSTE